MPESKVNDPTTKAMNNLIESLLEQKRMSETNVKKCVNEPLKRRIIRARNTAANRAMHRAIKCKTKDEQAIPKKQKTIAKKTIAEITVKMLPERKPADISGIPAKKAKRQEEDDKSKPEDYGTLFMERLQEHTVPQQIFKAEMDEDSECLNTISRMIKDSSTDRYRYTEAYTALLHLEEAAEVLCMRKYNKKCLKLSYAGFGTIFKIEIDVSFLFSQLFCLNLNHTYFFSKIQNKYNRQSTNR